MGVDLHIGEDQLRVTSYYWYNEFYNWVARIEAETGEKFPHILEHSPTDGDYLLSKSQRASTYRGSIPKLKEEVIMLFEHDPPDYGEWCLEIIMDAITLAELKNKKITMDGGVWFGEMEGL